MTVQTWLWIGTIGMSIGLILLFFPMQKNKSVSEQEIPFPTSWCR